MESRQFVTKFCEAGYILTPVGECLVAEAREAFTFLIDRFKECPESFGACRKGEDGDPDIGMVYRRGVRPNSDWKHFFHFSSDFFRYLTPGAGEVIEALGVLSKLYCSLNMRAYEFAEMLADRKIINSSTAGSVLTKIFEPTPYCATILRGLWYPAGVQQKGAHAHIDRSLFSIHLGDAGGELYALTCEEDDAGVVISPPHGYAVIFPGVKMCLATNGRIRPLWHKSSVEPGQDRRAMVQFVQADVGISVQTARVAYDAFLQQHSHQVTRA